MDRYTGDSRSGWWFSSDRKWRKGKPPAGWEQGPDGRWHSPYSAETEELTYLARTSGAAPGKLPPPADAADFGPDRPAGAAPPAGVDAGAEADVGAPTQLTTGYADDQPPSASVFATQAGYADHAADDYYYDDDDDDSYYYDDEDEGYDEPAAAGAGFGAGRHLAGLDDPHTSSRIVSYQAWPSWARIAAPISAGLFLLGAVGAVAAGSGGGGSPDEESAGGVPTVDTTVGMPTTDAGPRQAPAASTTTTAGTGVAPGPTTTQPTGVPEPAPTTTDPAPSTTATTNPPDAPPQSPATTAPGRAEAPPDPCSPEAGHSLTWYLINGVICG